MENRLDNKDRSIHPVLSHGFHHSYGLTRREYFAGLILQTLISSADLKGVAKIAKEENVSKVNMLAKIAIGYADVLLEELEK